MYKDVLRSIEGIEMGSLFSFLLFFGFFLILIVYLIRMKKDFRDEMKNIPLD